MNAASSTTCADIGRFHHPLVEFLGTGIVWDNHACMPLRPDDLSLLPQLERVRGTGVHVLSLNVGFGAGTTRELTLAMLASFRRWIRERPDGYVLVERAEDGELARSTGKLGVCFDLEGMDPLEGDPDAVRKYYEQGVRWMLATYNRPNAAGGGCLGQDAGLTSFGREVVRTMNETGMVVCGSHCGYRTARELIDLSESPVIFSHSNPRAVWDHPRNIPDDLMLACARRGGVIGINGFGPFLGNNDASTVAFTKHVEYALGVVGEDHVGIGLDFVYDAEEMYASFKRDPASFPPALYGVGPRMVEPWRLPEIAKTLSDRGHRLSTLRKIFGGNFLRIAREVWR